MINLFVNLRGVSKQALKIDTSKNIKDKQNQLHEYSQNYIIKQFKHILQAR